MTALRYSDMDMENPHVFGWFPQLSTDLKPFTGSTGMIFQHSTTKQFIFHFAKEYLIYIYICIYIYVYIYMYIQYCIFSTLIYRGFPLDVFDGG